MSKKSMIKKLRESYEKYGIIKLSRISSIPIDYLCDTLELKLKTFDDLEFKPHPYTEGVVSRIMFDNGYGASVVCNESSYGGKKVYMN
jgi:hypothetical protein